MDLGTGRPCELAALAEAPPQSPLLRAVLSVSYGGAPPVLDGAALTMAPGEIVGLVGLSGSGKSTFGLTLLGLISLKGGKPTGSMELDGRDLLGKSESAWSRLRGKEIALVPQSPLASLNPVLSIGRQLREAWRAHDAGRDWMPRAVELLDAVGLPGDAEFLARLPRQLSVGMAQRVLIAMALLHRPRLLIADEPTSALDPITQAEILDVFRMLNRTGGTAMLYISHDLLSVASLCHRMAILYRGRIVEQGTPAAIFQSPEHPHTRSLIAAIPIRKPSAER